ncbi:LacI family DNA-binding transcriptional regulator, partial [Acinetobacter baumannii]
VSAMTVSRAFKTPDRVADSLRERIQAAARELGYLPNRAASQLASARSMTIAVLIPSLTNTVFIDTVAGIHQVMHPEGYQILIGVTGYS